MTVSIFAILLLLTACANSQTPEVEPQLVSWPCEGCVAVLEYGNRSLHPIDTLPGFGSEVQELKISGTIYQADGKTPAHIHPYFVEPNGKYYWLAAYHFRVDALLTKEETLIENPRGGSARLVILDKSEKIWKAKRDFILGENINGHTTP